ncbi:MAG: V-type ATPase subunit [Candidatus Brocadiia bacterium]
MVAAVLSPPVPGPAAWTYASGLASALEGRLLTARGIEELLQAPSLEELLGRVRQGLMFGDLAESAQPFALAENIEAAHAAMVRRMGEACPAPDLADLFLLPLEWRAFRAYVRTQALEREPAPVPGAEVPEAVWERCWTTPDVEARYEPFAQAAAAIREAMPREEHDQRLVEGFTHIYEARHLRRLAAQVGSEAVLEWVETWLRQRLALALLRCRFNQWGHVRAADALDDLGVSHHQIRALVEPEQRDWRAPLAALGLPAAAAIRDDQPRPAAVVERLIDDAMTGTVRQGRGVPFGPEPLAGFLWALRVEALNVKLVVTGRAAGVGSGTIAEDLRQSYV